MKNDVHFWARLLVIAKNRNVNLEHVLTYSPRACPRALATYCGGLVKTSKSKLLHILEQEAGEPLIVQVPESSSTVIDGVALLQAMNAKDIPDTFGVILKKIIAIAVVWTSLQTGILKSVPKCRKNVQGNIWYKCFLNTWRSTESTKTVGKNYACGK